MRMPCPRARTSHRIMAYYRWGILAFKPRMGVSWDNSKESRAQVQCVCGDYGHGGKSPRNLRRIRCEESKNLKTAVNQRCGSFQDWYSNANMINEHWVVLSRRSIDQGNTIGFGRTMWDEHVQEKIPCKEHRYITIRKARSWSRRTTPLLNLLF